MSELVLNLVAGPVGRNSGYPRSVGVLGALHVGGSGLWVFSGEDPNVPGLTRRVRVEARDDLAVEVLAGFALAADLEGASTVADRVLASNWREEPIRSKPKDLQPLAEIAGKANVAVVITDFSGIGKTIPMAEALSEVGWSVIVATPTLELKRSQWDQPRT